MLTPDYLEHVADDVIELYAKFEQAIIRDIAKRLSKTNLLVPSVNHQIKVLQESGMLYEDIIKEIAKFTGKSEEKIKQIFENSAVKSITLDDNIYKKAGFNPIPLKQSESMLQMLVGGLEKTNKQVKNLTMTLAGNSQAKFTNAVNLAYMQVTSGAFDKNTAILNAVKVLSEDGLDIVYPSGKTSKIDVAVRRAVVTGVNQTCGKLQEIRADEFECDLMELTAHPGARVTEKNDYTNHAWWQGKIVSRSGQKGYLSLEDIGYGEITGFLGINCRHGWSPFFEGITKRRYTDEELANINNQSVNYKDKEMGLYEATKTQRSKERNIRKLKREVASYEEILKYSDDEDLKSKTSIKYNNAKQKLKETQKELKEFTNETGLQRDYSRERIVASNGIKNNEINGIIKANNDSVEDKLKSKVTLVEKIPDLSNENKINTLKKYEEKIVNEDVENSVVIDKKGNTYLIKSNSSNSVYIKGLGEEILKDSYMTHNHPMNETRYSFSGYDISEFMSTNMQLLRGIDYKYIYEIEKTEDTLTVNSDNILYEFSNTLRYEALDKIIKENLDADEYEYHIINQLLAKKYNYKYRRIIREQ